MKRTAYHAARIKTGNKDKETKIERDRKKKNKKERRQIEVTGNNKSARRDKCLPFRKSEKGAFCGTTRRNEKDEYLLDMRDNTKRMSSRSSLLTPCTHRLDMLETPSLYSQHSGR